MFTKRFRATIVVSLSVLAIAMFLASIPLAVTAQGDITPKTATPRPTPKNNGGNATWTVKSASFQSNYPKGIEFDLGCATSTGGKIVSAMVLFNLSPNAGSRAPGKIDGCKITAISTMTGMPQWVGILYRWILTDEKGNTLETTPIQAEYADTTRVWQHVESEDVIVFWQDGVPDSIGRMVTDAMKQQHDFYYQNWGKLLNYRPRIIIYKDFKPWAEWNPGAGTAAPNGVRVVGETSHQWGGTVQVYLPKEGVLGLAWGTALHEVGHLYQFQNGGVVDDCWFIEGDATYFEVVQDYSYLGRVKQMAANGTLPTLQNGGPACQGNNARDAYDIGYAFWRYLAEIYGPDAHRNVWDLLAKGKTHIDALQTVTGKSFTAMETEFRAWLGMRNPEAPTPFPTETFDFPPTPTYEPTSTPKP